MSPRSEPRWSAVDPGCAIWPEEPGSGRRLGRSAVPALTLILDRNFMATRHLLVEGVFISRGKASRGMQRLYRAGLVAHAAVPSWRRGGLVGWEYAYALTRSGLEWLADGRADEAARVRSGWRPPFEAGGSRINPRHEIAVADLCYAVKDAIFAAEYRQDAKVLSRPYWVGSRSIVQKLNGGMLERLRERKYVSPDAAVVVLHETAINVILVEYEESLRPDTLLNKLSGYAAYFSKKVWSRRFPGIREPKVLVSVCGDADRQRYYSHPYDEAVALARNMTGMEALALRSKVFFAKEDDWRHGVVRLVGMDGSPLPSVLDVAITRPLAGMT